jgi:DNA-binding transcriptional ArsR family regulator
MHVQVFWTWLNEGMAGTAEMLRATLGGNGYAVLLAVAGRAEPVSGRAIATELGVSPTTASALLSRLEVAGFVRFSQSGRSMLWRLNTDADVIRMWLREDRSSADVVVTEAGASPVSTGGGGVTFERKVAVCYLARLLMRHGSVGLGPSRVVISVMFQQAPEFTVDDLVVEAALEGEDEPSLVLAVAARRTPNVVDSDEKSQKLFRSFVKQLLNMPADGPQLRLGLAVAGPQDHPEQLKVLAGLAAGQPGAERFSGLVRTPKKFDKQICDRLVQVEKLVRRALVDLGVSEPSTGVVEQQVWELLSRLVVLMPRVENADDPDWSMLANLLIPVSCGKDLYGGTLLRDRLLVLADDWAPSAASVNMSMLRRAVHELVDPAVRRHRAGWRALELLGEQARAAVGDEIVSADGARRVRVDRGDVTAGLAAAVRSADGVIVHGESGVGKSAAALGLRTATKRGAKAENEPNAANDPVDADGAHGLPGESQVVCMNLRHLQRTALEFEGTLGVPLRDLLAEMSAPARMLVVDGADAVAEGAQDLLTYVVDAAVAADVTVVAVTASDAKQLVADTMARWVSRGVVEVAVPPLTDSQIDAVVGEFGELEPMAANARSRELLRRPVVADLLVRGGVQGTPVSDFDAMQQVWEGLVRRNGAAGRGSPDARDVAMQLLARHAVRGGDQLDVAASIDPDALAGLRKDGLLRTSQDNPFRPVPEFAHDEVRRYAVARLLLADGEPAKALMDAGVPRWALGAARLACQALFAAPDSASNPIAGRFMRWQGAFGELAAAGHGERWTDVPGEALLTLRDPRPVLREAWPKLQADDRAGVQRLIRLADQRLRGQNTFVRVAAVEPVVELLLEDETPWRTSKGERTLLLEWLRSLVGSNVPGGYALREQMRARLVEFSAAADERLRAQEEARAAARAAITDEQQAAIRGARKNIFGEIGYPRSRRRRPRTVISREVTEESVVELFALLGPDLGVDGEAVVRRIAGG